MKYLKDNEIYKKMQLGDVSTIQAGHPIRGEIQPVADGEVAVVQRRDVQPDQDIVLDQLVRIDLPGKRQPNYLQPEDILFVGRVERHRQPFAVRVGLSLHQTIAVPQLFVIRVTSPAVSPGYLTWYLNVISQPFFARYAVGTALLNITRPVLAGLPLTLPPLEVQQHIAKLCAARQCEKALIAALQAKRQTLLDAILKQAVLPDSKGR